MKGNENLEAVASEVQKEIFIWSVSGKRKSLNFSRGGMGAGIMVTGTYFCMEMTYLTVVILRGTLPPAQNQGSGTRDLDDLAWNKSHHPFFLPDRRLSLLGKRRGWD